MGKRRVFIMAHNLTLVYLNPLSQAETIETRIIENESIEKYTRNFTKYMYFPYIVFIPAADISIIKIYQPHLKNITSKTTEPLLYAIEHQLAEDIDNIILTLLEADKTAGYYTVAICHKTVIDNYFMLLEKLNYLPAVLMPDIFMLPCPAAAADRNSWSIYAAEDNLIVRTGIYEGFAVEKENFSLYLESIVRRAETLENTLSQQFLAGIIYNSDRLKLNSDQSLLGETERLEIKLERPYEYRNISLLELISQTNSVLPDINLLEHHPENVAFSRTRRLKKWTFTGLLAGIVLLVLILSHLTEYIYLKDKSSKAEAQIKEIYYQLYPHAQEIVSPKARMLQDLKNADSGKDSFWGVLIKIGQALNAQPSVELRSLRFENDQFQLMISAQNVEALETLNTVFKQSGLSVSGINIISADQQISETLSLK